MARFPSWETLPHERLSPRADTMAQRIAVLRRLVHPEKPGERAEAIRVLTAPHSCITTTGNSRVIRN